MSTLADWELLLALHHHVDPWDGLDSVPTGASAISHGANGCHLDALVASSQEINLR
jgi:hypothetical protein